MAGTDNSGLHLYYCDNDGNRIKGDVFTTGSGGTYATAIIDTYRKWDMTVEEAIELGKRAISEATFCDSGSGGVSNIVLITKDGIRTVVDKEDNSKLVWERIDGLAKH